MKKFLLGSMLAGALCFVPATLGAQDAGHGHDQNQSQNRTYHDTAHNDDHQWNDNENAAWNRYRDEHHVKQSDFSKARRKQQQAYWNWRHDHPDSH